MSFAKGKGSALIVTTGGTGPAPRDVTPEAIERVCHKLMPGFGEEMRRASLLEGVPTAILSRQTAGESKAIRPSVEVEQTTSPALPLFLTTARRHPVQVPRCHSAGKAGSGEDVPGRRVPRDPVLRRPHRRPEARGERPGRQGLQAKAKKVKAACVRAFV